MVTDIPSSSDFEAYGLRYLNLGWGMALTIARELQDIDEWGIGDEEVLSAFNGAAEPELATALTLVEQGVEFLLKGRIAAVSPWLLLSRDVNNWPRRADKEDVPFAEFHTLDAQDLVRVHDTVATERLPEEFVGRFRELRRKRNAVMHTVDRRVKATTLDVIEDVLVAVEALLVSQSWPELRLNFLETTRDAAYDLNSAPYIRAREFVAVLTQLKPAKLKRFFGLPTGRRMYLCPTCRHCYEDTEVPLRSAILAPNTPSSTQVHCFVCGQAAEVQRRKCVDAECRGNVIDPGWDECLTCGTQQ